jgi:hypothetical protein
MNTCGVFCFEFTVDYNATPILSPFFFHRCQLLAKTRSVLSRAPSLF